MAKLVYSMITSLDGFISDEDGAIEWGAPDPEVFAFVNDLERDTGTVLYGRRMYETMVYWETHGASPDDSPVERDFAELWRAQDKIVYSTTLEQVSSARTSLERTFVPDAVRRLKQDSTRDLSIAGPHLASQAIEARLVDDMHLFVVPVTLGGGTPAHPGKEQTDLALLDINRFESGIVHLHYRFDNAG
jgi:dihydrofolate reductase